MPSLAIISSISWKKKSSRLPGMPVATALQSTLFFAPSIAYRRVS